MAATILLALSMVASAGAAITRPYSGVSFGPTGRASVTNFSEVQGITVDQSTGDVYVYDAGGGGKIYRFDEDGEPVDFSALGTNVIEGAGSAGSGENQIAVAPSGAPGGTAGDVYVVHSPGPVSVYSGAGVELGVLGEGETCGVAVDTAGHLFIGSYPNMIREYVASANPPTDGDLTETGEVAVQLCNLAIGESDQIYAANYEGLKIAHLSSIASTTPDFLEPGGRTMAADGPRESLLADQGNHVSEFSPTGSLLYTFGAGQITGSNGIALNIGSENAYVSDGGSGRVKIFDGIILPSPVTEAAAEVSSTSATAHGTVNPEGNAIDECFFEYGRTTAYGQVAPCVDPDAAGVGAGSAPVPVHAALTGLVENADYHFRLVAGNSGGTVRGGDKAFSTTGPPTITKVTARNADRASVTLTATIDPHGFNTQYHFEWGASPGYGNRVPDVGDTTLPGPEPRQVSISLSGLSAATRYHYRLVASSEGGSTTTTDREFETLNACSLPDRRCFEMVSPKELGPTAAPGRFFSSVFNINFQASTESQGGLAYGIEGGLPDATRGGEVLYRATRGTQGWASSQFDVPILARNEVDAYSAPGTFLGLSRDLSCGVLRSSQPLTADPAARLEIEVGGENLYRANPDGTYTLITNLPPLNPKNKDQVNYRLVGISANCGRVVFSAALSFPGLPGVGTTRLYEWAGGALMPIYAVPGEGGDAPTEIKGGGGTSNILGAVSRDGSRVFFTAESHAGNDKEHQAVFLRANGTQPIDVSQSSLEPNTGAVYQAANPDGTKVYFTAIAGLTAESSSEGTDLYEYDVTSATLTDLSAVGAPGGAEVGGLLGFADDGSHVYFATRGQLVPEQGRTFAENLAGHTYSVFDWTPSGTRYVGSLSDGDVLTGGAVIRSPSRGVDEWRSRVSDDGKYLLFESSANEAASGSGAHVFLYRADEAQEPVVCVSCRFDGGPTLSPGTGQYLVPPGALNTLYAPASLVVHDGSPEVFFTSRDPLASGAVEGNFSVYEWSHDQVFLIAGQTPGSTVGSKRTVKFLGASTDGSNLYLFDAAPLNWENPQGRDAAWDARVGGGFPPPPTLRPCNADVESSCQGQGAQAPSQLAPPTATFVGQGNVPPHTNRKKKHKHKQEKRHKHKHRKARKARGHKPGKARPGHAVRENANRRVGN